MGEYFLVLLVVGFFGAIFQMIVDGNKKEKLNSNLSSADRKLVDKVNIHLDALASKRRQMVFTDEYGKFQNKRWVKEVDQFMTEIVFPSFTHLEFEALNANPNQLDRWFVKLDRIVRHRSEEIAAVLDGGINSVESPIHLEQWCARQLVKLGAKARTTVASGDQGADVIADYLNQKIVIQCKLYSKPVGNKAVQEAFSAKSHYGATLAAVLSPSGYTKSAKELASTTGVLLLTEADLLRLEAIFPK